ncbi:MAG: polysaccharide biosynthesis/export family protein [Gemmataceae bacterium]|nr:polysaccharide biosynthesis/export family protein [Gemmataceae bacterium]
MAGIGRFRRLNGLALAAAAAGCHGLPSGDDCWRPPRFDPCCVPAVSAPRELNKVSLPPYVIEVPDVLRIEAARLVPLPTYRVGPLDRLYVVARPGTVFEEEPINGVYPVDPDGTIDLGPKYRGRVSVADRTVEEAAQAVQAHVRRVAKAAEVAVSLAQAGGLEPVAGHYLVRPDGTVGLGGYGDVYVNGLTRYQAKQAIEERLGGFVNRPEVSVDVAAYCSKVYYVVTDLGGAGEQVVKLPHTGNETVLDGVAQVGGLAAAAGKRVWVARPAPPEAGGDTVLPVDWCGVVQRGRTGTNYQLLPGDRVYVVSRPPGRFARLLGLNPGMSP